MSSQSSTEKIRERVRQSVLDANTKEPNVREAMLDVLRCIPKEESVTVFMSGGIDSHLCLFACIELGLNPTVTSFTLDTHESADFKSARHAADVFNLPFQPVILDSSEKHIKKWVRFATSKLGLTTKSSIECSWPLYIGIRSVKQKHLIFGLGGDSYFLMSKSASMHCKDLVAESRRRAFRRPLVQNDLVKRECFRRDKVAHLPFFEFGRMYTELQGATDFAKINSPQKSFYNLAYPELRKKCKVRGHQNFQLGDSNISGIFTERLLKSDWNTRNLKSVVGIYNDIISGKL